MKGITLSKHQKELADEAKIKLKEHKQVGLDVFARGGKSYIAMELMNFLKGELGCKNFLVIAPKSIVNNLSTNLFKGYSGITYIGKELLSRNYSLEDLIKSKDISPECIDAIIFDEAHTMFGQNIGAEINSAMKYIKSKYVIAMTATPYNNLKGVNALENLIRQDCILHYDFNEAVVNKVITPVKYIPAVLRYNSDCYKKLKELKNNIICENDYIVRLYEQLEHQVKMLEGDLEDKLFEYIKDRIVLDASEGGRIFVFFNRVDEIEKNRDVIENVINRLYTYWGNSFVKVNFYEYTSQNSKHEDEEVLEMIGRDPYPNNIDIIATVNKGSMGIHPSNVHFGLIMCGTQSITKYMQLVGRITNLTKYDKNETVIFDFRDNRSFLGKVSINVGRQKFRDRREFKRNRALTFFNEEVIEKDLKNSVKLMPCTQLEHTIDLFERINNLMVLSADNTELIRFLTKRMGVIDKDYNGNISKYLKSQADKHLNSKTSHSKAWYNKYQLMYEKYNQVRKALMFDGFNAEDKKSVEAMFNMFEYRIYIDKNDSEQTIEYIKRLYEDFMDVGGSNFKIKRFIDKYCYDYLTDGMTSGCYALIQSNDKVASRMLSRANQTVCSNNPDVEIDSTVVELCKKLSSNLELLSHLAGVTYKNDVDKIYLQTSIIYRYIQVCKLDEKSAAYVDNITRYVSKFHGDIIKEANNRLHSRDEKPKLERIVDVMNGYKNGHLHELGRANLNLERTVAVISKTEKFEDLDEIYKVTLELFRIKTIKTFNKLVVPKTYMAKLVDEYLDNFDRDKLLMLESFIRRGDMPESLDRKLSSYNNDKVTYKNCSDRDIKIAVQSLLKDNNKEHVDLLRNAIRKKRVTNEEVIVNAFSMYTSKSDLEEVKKFINGDEYNKRAVINATMSTTLTVKILMKLSESGALHKEYSTKVKDMIAL